MIAPTPGAYLKMRRCAAGLSVADVAARIETLPYLPQHERADWLEMIEADVTPASFATIAALRSVVRFDLRTLAELELLRMGLVGRAPPLCRICAESLLVPATPDLCLGCAEPGRASAA